METRAYFSDYCETKDLDTIHKPDTATCFEFHKYLRFIINGSLWQIERQPACCHESSFYSWSTVILPCLQCKNTALYFTHTRFTDQLFSAVVVLVIVQERPKILYHTPQIILKFVSLFTMSLSSVMLGKHWKKIIWLIDTGQYFQLLKRQNCLRLI